MLKDNTPLTDMAVKVPGQLFKNLGCPEAADFFSDETSFTTTGEFNNGNGGHIYHGEYVTHGKDGGAMEYLYIVIASSEPTADYSQTKIIPHFIYLGGLMSGEQQQGVYATFLLTQAEYDGEHADFTFVDEKNFLEVISALAYADIPFKKILAGEKVDADLIAAAFSMTTPDLHVDKFYDTVNCRNACSLSLGMNT